jgi:hypothetical protein
MCSMQTHSTPRSFTDGGFRSTQQSSGGSSLRAGHYPITAVRELFCIEANPFGKST